MRGKAVGSRARVVLKKSLVRVRACPVSGDCGFGADRAPTQNPTDHEETSREPPLRRPFAGPLPAEASAATGKGQVTAESLLLCLPLAQFVIELRRASSPLSI